jgi:hypothetical protein
MTDTERHQPLAAEAEYRLSQEEIDKIKRKAEQDFEESEYRAREEAKARRRRAPYWNPEIPWRPLQDIFIAVLKASTAISTGDLEKILSRGKVPMTGIRDHIIGEHAERIEKLVAVAKARGFYFSSNSIWILTADSKPPAIEDHPYCDMLIRYGEQTLFGPKSTLRHRPLSWSSTTFDRVRVDWPAFVKAAQESGFDICLEPKHQTAPRGVVKRPMVSTRPRPKVGDDKMRAWYLARVKECKDSGERPSGEDDWRAAQQEFKLNVRQDQIRRVRNELAPGEWRKQGRRPKAAQSTELIPPKAAPIKVTPNSIK